MDSRESDDVGLRTRVCDLLKIRHPIVLGGMASHTSPELVAAVSNAGGLGIYGATWRTTEEIHRDTARIRELTPAPFGLNLLLFARDDAALQAVIDERPPLLSFAWPPADLPLDAVFARAHAAGALVMHMVARADEAQRAVRAGADIIVAQGTEGGGHVGVMGTMTLVPLVIEAVSGTPVLAAGGIADGRGLAAALALGADGVLMGTRFLATPESPLHPNFKQAILDSDGHDTDVLELPDVILGRTWPGAFSRVRRNALIREWSGREWEVRLRQPAVRAAVAAAREQGDADRAILFIGQDAGLIHDTEPAGRVVHRMVREAHAIVCDRLAKIAATAP